MAHFSIYDGPGQLGLDYQFIDEVSREFFWISGTCIYLHKYLGPKETGQHGDSSQQVLPGANELTIQDMVLLENRDVKYDPNRLLLYGYYNMGDASFDLTKLALNWSGDMITIEFHLIETIEKVGRKLMSGDVIELPHMRDQFVLSDGPAINKLYVIQEAEFATSGYDPKWLPHVLRCTAVPLVDAPEYADVFESQDEFNDETLKNILSTYNVDIEVDNKVEIAAFEDVPLNYYDHTHFYVMPGKAGENQFYLPLLMSSDGVPPNGAKLAAKGPNPPMQSMDGDYWLDTRTNPHVLFQFEGSTWIRREIDYRKTWSVASRLLDTFVNNKKVNKLAGINQPERQALSKAVSNKMFIKPKADL